MTQQTYHRVVTDYQDYPHISSSDGKYFCDKGYFYIQTSANNFSRPVYARLYVIQTYPNKVFEAMGVESATLPEIKAWLKQEAEQILAGLVDGSVSRELYGRFQRCSYDENGRYIQPGQAQAYAGYTARV